MDKPGPKGRNDSHIFDYSEITDQIFLGSDLCKAGVCLIHKEEFKSLGVDVELNLSDESNELPPDNIEAYSWIPIVDGHSPSQAQLDLGTSIINEVVKNNKKVYIHCRNGHGRSPTMVAAYLIRFKGYETDDAMEFLKEKRGEIHIEEDQIKNLKEFKERWSK